MDASSDVLMTDKIFLGQSVTKENGETKAIEPHWLSVTLKDGKIWSIDEPGFPPIYRG